MNEAIDAAAVLELLPEIVWREVAGEAVILDQEDNILMGLNGSGGRMWELLDGKRSLADIAGDLVAHYKQPEAAVLADVLRFAQTLLEKNLARVIAAA